MTNYDTPTENDFGGIDCPRIGTDASGAVHYLDDANNRILVTRDGDVEHVQPLSDRSVAEWRAYIADQHEGWVETGTDQLASAVRSVAGVC